jgi:hypothetical protein
LVDLDVVVVVAAVAVDDTVNDVDVVNVEDDDVVVVGGVVGF